MRDKIIDIISTENIRNSYELKKSLLDGIFKNYKKHFQTNCIKFELIEGYAKEGSNLNMLQKFVNMINIQEKWYLKKKPCKKINSYKIFMVNSKNKFKPG